MGDLGFPDLWSYQKPWWNWYFTPVENYGEVLRAQFSQIHSLRLHAGAPFKVCSGVNERVGCRKQREATAPIHP